MTNSLGRAHAVAACGAILLAACSGSPAVPVSPSGAEVATLNETDPPPDPATGRFTGGGFQLSAARVTRGFTIHCDLVLSNNLEVNWGGNHFHMTQHLTTVACTDDDDILQPPPAAPVDTIVGVGTGRYNGVDGYTIEFTLVDAGEPGRNDQAALRIFNGTGDVLNIPLSRLDGGNVQAHFDQPHRQR